MVVLPVLTPQIPPLLLRGPSGGQEAWDFSPLPVLCASVLLFPIPPLFPTVFSSVESRTRAFLNTASECAQAGISFCSLFIEAVGGGWSDALLSVVSWIASESNRCSPVRRSSFKIAQRISRALHRENARAILKRAPEQTGTHSCSLGLSLLSDTLHDWLIAPLFLVSGRWLLWGGVASIFFEDIFPVAHSHIFQAFVDPFESLECLFLGDFEGPFRLLRYFSFFGAFFRLVRRVLFCACGL